MPRASHLLRLSAAPEKVEGGKPTSAETRNMRSICALLTCPAVLFRVFWVIRGRAKSRKIRVRLNFQILSPRPISKSIGERDSGSAGMPLLGNRRSASGLRRRFQSHAQDIAFSMYWFSFVINLRCFQIKRLVTYRTVEMWPSGARHTTPRRDMLQDMTGDLTPAVYLRG